MPSYNTNTVFTRTATGTILRFTIYGPKGIGPFDADGKADLDGYTITATVRKRARSAPVITDAPCEADPDQTANKSVATWTLSSEHAAIPAGSYRLRFKITDGTSTWYAPTNSKGDAVKLTVVEP